MKCITADFLLSLILVAGIFVVCKTAIKPPITTEILAGFVIFVMGFILFLLVKKNTLMKRFAGIVSISGAVLAIGSFIMVFSILGRM